MSGAKVSAQLVISPLLTGNRFRTELQQKVSCRSQQEREEGDPSSLRNDMSTWLRIALARLRREPFSADDAVVQTRGIILGIRSSDLAAKNMLCCIPTFVLLIVLYNGVPPRCVRLCWKPSVAEDSCSSDFLMQVSDAPLDTRRQQWT